METRGVIVTTDSDITISGLNDGEVITFYSVYSVNGVNLGSAKAVQGVLHFAKPNESIVIAKIKGNDLKMLSSDICVWKSQFATSKLLQGRKLRL